MVESLSYQELFILLPKLMIFKEKRDAIEKIKKRELIMTPKDIFKVMGLNPTDKNNYKLLRKWSSPPYYFLTEVNRRPHKYLIEDKNFWHWFWHHQPSMNIIEFIKTKSTII